MATNSALELSIRIAGKIDPSLAKTFSAASKQVSSFSQGLSTIAKVTIGAVTGAATAMALGISNCTESAASFKNEMADVVKYVDGLADEDGLISDKIFAKEDNGNDKTYAENYAYAAENLKVLSTQIPLTKDELSQLTAAAGQSNKQLDDLFKLDTSGNIGGFVRDAAMLAAAWDIDALTAGDYAAKWEAAFGMSHEQVMILADQINYLGANSATTAAEIAQAVNSSASLGQIGGLDVATTAALADAMLATGVSSDRVGTSIKRMVTNLSKGASATKAEKETLEEMGMTAEWVAKAMQEDSVGALKTIFESINALPEERQVAALSNLFGAWAIEGGAKVAGNMEVFTEALDMVSDPERYTGSMEREFIIKSSTPEAVDLMTANARDNLMVDIGDAFLPLQQELARMKIDLFENIRASLPEISKLANSALPLIRAGMEGIGATLEKAMPYAQSLIDYVLNNGDKVASILTAIGTALAGMLFAPQIEGVVKSIAGLFNLGGFKTPGASWSGGNKTQGIIGTATGWIGRAAQAAAFGAGMANSGMTLVNGEAVTTAGSGGFLQSASNGLLGAIIGIQNQKTITASTGRDSTWWKNILGVADQITAAKQNGGLLNVVKSTGAGQYVSNILTATKSLGGTKIGGGLLSFAKGTGNVAKEILTGIAGPKAMDFRSLSNGLGLFGSATLDVLRNSGPAQAIGGAATALRASRPAQIITNIAGKVPSLAGGALGSIGNFAGGILNVGGATLGPLLKGGLSVFTGLMGTFGPIITGLGTVVALVSLFGDHLDDIRGLVQNVFGEKGVAIFDSFVGAVQSLGDKVAGAFSPQGMQNIQASIRETFGDGAANAFGVAIPLIESFAGVFRQIVDLGVNHIKPVLTDTFGFIINEGIPAVMPLLSTVVSLVGTTLVNAIKVVMDVVGMILSVVEPAILGIIDLAKSIVSVVVNVVNGIIGALNKIQITVPDWSPVFAGKTFGFNLQEVALPEYAAGGFTHGVSIAGEAGTEAVISFDPSVRSQNVATWMQAGQMLGVRQFANGGFTDGRSTMEDTGKLILFRSATSLLANAGRALFSGDPAAAMQDLVGTGLRRTAYELANFARDSLTLRELTGGSQAPIYLQDFLPRSAGEEVVLRDWPGTGNNPPRGGYPGGAGGDRPVQYVFAPQLTIYGDADRTEISETMDAEYEKFKRNVERFERERRSTQYA